MKSRSKRPVKSMRKTRSSRSKRPVRSMRKSRSSRSKRPDRSMRKCRKDSVNFGFYGRPDMNPIENLIQPDIIRELNQIENCNSNIKSFAYNKFYRNYSSADNLEKQFMEILQYRDAIWDSVVKLKRSLGHDEGFGSFKKINDRMRMKSTHSVALNQQYLLSCFSQYKKFPFKNVEKLTCFYNNLDKNDNKMYLSDSKIILDKSKIALEVSDLDKDKFAYIWNNIDLLLLCMYSIYIIKEKPTQGAKYTLMEGIIEDNLSNNSDIGYKLKEQSDQEKKEYEAELLNKQNTLNKEKKEQERIKATANLSAPVVIPFF
jgi:hypothetical protein